MRAMFLFCVALLTLAQTANAQTPEPKPSPSSSHEVKGLYLALRGYGAIEDENNLLFENSYEVAGAVGFRPYDSWRAEIEYARRNSNIVGLNGADNTRGRNRVDSLGFHVFHDFRAGHTLRPFLGIGAGVQRRQVSFVGTADIDPNFVVSADDDYTDAYANVLAGIGYHISPRLRLSSGLEYVTGRDRNIQANYRELPGINRSYNYYVGLRWVLPKRD